MVVGLADPERLACYVLWAQKAKNRPLGEVYRECFPQGSHRRQACYTVLILENEGLALVGRVIIERANKEGPTPSLTPRLVSRGLGTGP